MYKYMVNACVRERSAKTYFGPSNVVETFLIVPDIFKYSVLLLSVFPIRKSTFPHDSIKDNSLISWNTITKTRLFKYTEHFNHQKMKIFR